LLKEFNYLDEECEEFDTYYNKKRDFGKVLRKLAQLIGVSKAA
jgi:hypothetical protein